jgi:hypothetical protein
LAQAQSEVIKDADEKTRRLLHELNVHRIELELQNEELREAQRELELSRDRYLQLDHHAPIGYISVDSSGIIRQANHTFGHNLSVYALYLKPYTYFSDLPYSNTVCQLFKASGAVLIVRPYLDENTGGLDH